MKTLLVTLAFAVLSLMPMQLSAAPTDPTPAGTCAPPQVVASFLNLNNAQAAQFTTLLGQYLPVVQQLQQQVAATQAQLEAELNQPNPDGGQILKLVLQMHALQQQVAHAIQTYQNLFASLLTDEQKQKVQAITDASQLQPVVGAFVAIQLAPAPAPLPCQNQ